MCGRSDKCEVTWHIVLYKLNKVHVDVLCTSAIASWMNRPTEPSRAGAAIPIRYRLIIINTIIGTYGTYMFIIIKVKATAYCPTRLNLK